MDQSLLKILKNLAFTDKEARVYLALLELSQGTVSEIAKVTELKRTIIYVILDSLIKDGYATEIVNKNANKYQALDPSVILRKMKFSIKDFADMLPVMRTLHNKGRKKPKIHYIETKEGVLKISEEMMEAKDGIFITSYCRVNEKFSGIIDVWIKNAKKGITTLKGRHLIPNDPEEIVMARRLKRINQQIKILPGITKLGMDFSIYDNKLAITSLEDQFFLVLIESDELVNSMRMIFEIVWMNGENI